MNPPNILPLALGVVIFSFLVTSVFVVPFIDLLYKIKLLRRKEADRRSRESLFDKLHDKKAGTPIGGGILLILLVCVLFASIFPLASYLGIIIRISYNLRSELFVIFFTFISFGLLGLLDDYLKVFGKPKLGMMGSIFGLSRLHKFVFQWILAGIVGYLMYKNLGIQFFYIPILDITLKVGIWYVPLAALIIVTFTNAYNITDGLDGLATGLLIICLLAFGVIVAGNLDTPLSIFIAIWLGTLLAFLYFNIWPARIFLGDAGALSFGATLAVVGLITGSTVALFVIGGIFFIEIASSAIQIAGWKFLKKPIFPLAPIHHTFLAIGWEEPKIVMRAWLIGVVLAIFGLWLATI